MKPFSCVWRRNMINATRTSSFEVWKPHICKNICFASRWINMFLCALFTCLSVDPHICICIYADFWGGSHTQQGSLSVTVSQCEFVSLCLVLLGMSMCVSVCVCKLARVCWSVFSIYLFSRSFYWCLLLHILYFIMCVCVYVPYCVSDFSKWATTSRWCSVSLFGKWILELYDGLSISPLNVKRRWLYIHNVLFLQPSMNSSSTSLFLSDVIYFCESVG